MSKQLTFSAAFSVLAMVGSLLFGVPETGHAAGGAAAILGAKADAGLTLPSLGALLPGLR